MRNLPSESNPAEQAESSRLHQGAPDESQFTFRSIFVGCLIGGVICSMNLYLGLRIGWSIGGSLMAAILGFAFFSLIKPSRSFTVLEANMTQTAASGAGTMATAAGLLSVIPALQMTGFQITLPVLMLWSLAVAFQGVMFAVPLRRQYVEIEQLRFPSGTATADTIVAMFATAGESLQKARVLVISGIVAFVYMVAAFFWETLSTPPLHQWLSVTWLTSLAAWGFSIHVSPMLFGAGLLIGPRIGVSLILGSLVGWLALGGLVLQEGWATHPNPMMIHDAATNTWGVRGWILGPGVAIMVADALVTLALSWKSFVHAFMGTKQALGSRPGASLVAEDSQRIPNQWWIGGLIVSSIGTTVIAWLAFDIAPWLTVIAILLSAILANVAVRSVGETDINPVSGMGKITQAIFGALSNSVSTNLLAGGITGAGAAQAADMMQDLKTGHLLGASPRAQFKAQIWGILAGVLFAVPVYLLFEKAWGIGVPGSPLGAPAAFAWKAVSEIMAQGFENLPPMAIEVMVLSLLLGASFPLLKLWKPQWSNFIPSGMAFGIAFIVQAFYTIPMFLGSVVIWWWTKRFPLNAGRFAFALACGLIAGEGLAGICNAILTLILR